MIISYEEEEKLCLVGQLRIFILCNFFFRFDFGFLQNYYVIYLIESAFSSLSSRNAEKIKAKLMRVFNLVYEMADYSSN
jgi:hypothetical protein